MLCYVRTRACRRCGGDLSMEREVDGICMECIQCGAVFSEAELAKPPAKKTGEPVMTAAGAANSRR